MLLVDHAHNNPILICFVNLVGDSIKELREVTGFLIEPLEVPFE